MIVVRNVFRLKFGKAREAIATVKEQLAIQKRILSGTDYSARVLTDVTGPFYTLVFELTFPNLSAYDAVASRVFADHDWHASYQKLIPLVDSGSREVFTIVD